MIHGKRDAPWWEQAQHIAERIALARHYAFYEQPYFIPGVAGNARQDITKLTTTAGWIAGNLSARGVTVLPIEVLDWKGQTPKPIMQRRIKARLPTHTWTKSGHDCDAAGVGLYILGML